jgi:hypothetical protein
MAWLCYIPTDTAVDFTLDIVAPQIEVGNYPTSPILPPVGTPAQATRVKDWVNVNTAAVGLASSNQGTIVAKMRPYATGPAPADGMDDEYLLFAGGAHQIFFHRGAEMVGSYNNGSWENHTIASYAPGATAFVAMGTPSGRPGFLRTLWNDEVTNFGYYGDQKVFPMQSLNLTGQLFHGPNGRGLATVDFERIAFFSRALTDAELTVLKRMMSP